MPTIIQFWEQGSLPAPLLERCHQWQRLNPEWGYERFDLQAAYAFIGKAYSSDLAEAFLDIRFPAMKADVFRVAYLLHAGGMWVDVGTYCKSPLEQWLDPDWPLVLVRKSHMEPPLVGNSLIYARNPGHPFLLALWHHISNVILLRQGTGVWKLVGPGAYRDLLKTGCYDQNTHILLETELQHCFGFSSTALVLNPNEHWSKRQQSESLYFSSAPNQ